MRINVDANKIYCDHTVQMNKKTRGDLLMCKEP